LKIACLTFTQSGEQIAATIRTAFRKLGSGETQVDIFTKNDYKEHLHDIFREYTGIVFISSTGIAVRLSAPFLQDKTRDPAVVVVDDLGRYAISLISGHLGGANDLTNEIADILDCQPIITTASDGRGIEAVDLFAKRNNLFIENLNDAKIITAMMAEGHPIRLISEIDARIGYDNIVDDNPAGCIYVTSQDQVNCDVPYCILRPKNLNVGLGCRRGKTKEEILKAITQVFQKHNLHLNSIKAIATIDVKKDEVGILETCKALLCELHFYTREDIKQVQHHFSTSQWVQSTIGVFAVCEPCTYLAGGELIVEKTVIDGITVAVSRK
jgi:cobalt-precorrin 5A hydrolase